MRRRRSGELTRRCAMLVQQANERQRARADGDRIKELQDKLVLRIRPFVEAKNPGDPSDSETKVFEQRIRTEAEDMKLESFGIEVSGWDESCDVERNSLAAYSYPSRRFPSVHISADTYSYCTPLAVST